MRTVARSIGLLLPALVGCGPDGSERAPDLAGFEGGCPAVADAALGATATTRLTEAGVPVAADHLLLELDPAFDQAALGRSLADAGVCLGVSVEGLRGERAIAKLLPGVSLVAAAAWLEAQPGVLAVRFDPIAEGVKKDDEPLSPSYWHVAALRLGPALEQQPTTAPMLVAVLDTGLSLDGAGHPEAPGLEDVPTLPGWDFINGDADPADDNGHGTLLASILASQGELPGVAPGVTLMPIKVLDADRLGTESAIASGIDLATEAGADVISMSLAFPSGYIPSAELAASVRNAARAGVVLVGASGNVGEGEVAYPAAFGEVIAVGAGRLTKNVKHFTVEQAFDHNGSGVANKLGRADYSSWGAPLDLLAPGGSMEHDYDGDGFPDAIPGISFTAADPSYAAYLIAGTSPATVQVSGLAALSLAAGAAPSDVRWLLAFSAHDLGDKGFDNANGSGVPDAKKALETLDKDKLPALPTYWVNPIVTLATDGNGQRRALGLVEVRDELNQPVVGVKVLGHFRGPFTHDVAALTDSQGRALFASLPASPSAQLWELGVDTILGKKKKNGKLDLVIVPREQSSFDAASFRFLSAFRPEGAGVGPSPFMIFTDPDLLEPFVADFASDMIRAPDPATPVVAPIETIPADVESWVLVPSLQVRSFGPAAGWGAPTVMVIERAALIDSCPIVERGLPVYSSGVGVGPSPFHIDDSLRSDPDDGGTVTMRGDGLLLDDTPVSEADLGLVFGDQGRVLINVDGSVCVPQGFRMTDLGLLSQDVHDGNPVDDGGFGMSVDDMAPPPPAESGPYDVEDTALGSGFGPEPFASGSSAAAEAAVAGWQ